MNKSCFSDIYKASFIEHWDSIAMQDYGKENEYTYGHVAKKIAELHIVFDLLSLKRGDKVAVLGKNSSSWAITYIAIITKGLVVVPILDEFNPKDVVHILNHSESKALFADDWFIPKIKSGEVESLLAIFNLSTHAVVDSLLTEAIIEQLNDTSVLMNIKYPDGFSKECVDYQYINNNDVIVINYTSGTTALTKGVMLMDKNITGNITFGVITLTVGLSRSLAILPMAHVYGLMFSVLCQLAFGGKVTFLAKIPSPAILLDACKQVRPTLLCLVPLIFEKIYKMRIKPKLDKPMMKFLCSLPFIKNIIYKSIGKKLYNQLGGKGLYQVIIGGAAINKDVELFLRKIKFPFLVGYGMTECAPLMSYIDHKEFVLESVGKELGGPRASIRIVKENHKDEVGEIQVFGDHVMKGYYKDEEATKNTFTDDLWLKSGDLGYLDSDGNLYIKGRSKTMILGPSGENIYPEAIESKLLNMPFISECIVMQNKAHKLIAFVYPDYQGIEAAGISLDKLNRLMANNRRTINDEVAKYENIQRIEVVLTPFPKTPKNTIKRHGLEHLLDESDKNKAKALAQAKVKHKIVQKEEKMAIEEGKKNFKKAKEELKKSNYAKEAKLKSQLKEDKKNIKKEVVKKEK